MKSGTQQDIIVTVKVVPGSSRTEIAGTYGDMLKVKIAAPPEKGKANKALLDFLAKQLGIRKNALHIESGQTSCVKQIRLEGANPDDIQKLYGK